MSDDADTPSPRWRLNRADVLATLKDLGPIVGLLAALRVLLLFYLHPETIRPAIEFAAKHPEVTTIAAVIAGRLWTRFAAGHPVAAARIRDRVATLKELAHAPSAPLVAATLAAKVPQLAELRGVGPVAFALADDLARGLQVDRHPSGDSVAGILNGDRDRPSGSGRPSRDVRIAGADGTDTAAKGLGAEPQ